MVWSRHEETLEFGYRPVTETASFEDKQIYEVVVTNKEGKRETYQTTEEHPFWIHEFDWLPASSLMAGMTLVDRNNQTLTVVSQSKLNKTDTVYNFTVDEFHTYHIGELGVWVHNNDCFAENIRNANRFKPNDVQVRLILRGNTQIIAKGRNINKVDELVEKFGGRASDWSKMKGWDSNGTEYHWYKLKNGPTVGWKIKGQNDPF